MKIKRRAYFKDQVNDLVYFRSWVNQLEAANGRQYEQYELHTSLGKTHVWGLNTTEENLDSLVIFPGARTTSLIWDFDNGLDNLNHKVRLFLVETNGLPNLSHGDTPAIDSLDYGVWASEVFEGLHLKKAFVAGASFGGLICMKLGLVAPEKIEAAFLLNPGCLQPFSLSLKNLYYNLLPILRPTQRNVSTFLDKAIFSNPNHQLSETAKKMLVDYEVFALNRYKDNTQKPYYMAEQLSEVKTDTYLLVGDQDLLFPWQQSAVNAKKHLKNLREIKVFENVGHGIETYPEAMAFIGAILKHR
ncbi:alpha/beta fold hydrolase [Spirosoma flavum]|uniref:Alpha/beta fold hydrolase n=1 Tax=Spirosoma flavum TaxID=2048557 RepID=A0ABW6APQ7_9BACT